MTILYSDTTPTSSKSNEVFEYSKDRRLYIISRPIYYIRVGMGSTPDKDKGFTNGLILRITN